MIILTVAVPSVALQDTIVDCIFPVNAGVPATIVVVV